MFFVARMILDYAAKNGGIVVSRDNYRDLMRVGIRTNLTGQYGTMRPGFVY